MKIYILPYTFRTYFSYEKRVSGVDEATLVQINALKSNGHNVRTFIPFTDVHKHLENICIYKENIPNNVTTKELEKSNRTEIYNLLFKDINNFKPDVILSNFAFNKSPYTELMALGLPIIYMSMAVPGFWSDLNNAELLNEFVNQGNTLCCVSNYHKERTKIFYSRDRWDFNIEADYVLFCSFSKKENILPPDKVLRHVSAANKGKSTFYIHKMLHKYKIKSEVFTTLGYLHSQNKQDEYVEQSLINYPDNDYCKTNFDVDHTSILKNIGKSFCNFVGLASYDTFTITSLESLSRGVPLILKGYKGLHPATEMVEPSMQKYVTIVKNTQEFNHAIARYMKTTFSERQDLAESCYKITSKENYKNNIEKLLTVALEKK